MKIVVTTCDTYSEIASTFLHFYKKNWSDNPYQTEYVTETIEIDGMPTFCAGKIPWSDRMIKYLEAYNEDAFLLIMDDCFITNTVNTNAVQQAEKTCIGDIGCIRLNHLGSYGHFLFDGGLTGFKEYPRDKPYAVSLIACIWQKEYFLEFLKKGETAWQTETEGSKRVRISKKRILRSDILAISHFNGGLMKKGRVNKVVEQWVKENW